MAQKQQDSPLGQLGGLLGIFQAVHQMGLAEQDQALKQSTVDDRQQNFLLAQLMDAATRGQRPVDHEVLNQQLQQFGLEGLFKPLMQQQNVGSPVANPTPMTAAHQMMLQQANR